jgi:hypothetical protein
MVNDDVRIFDVFYYGGALENLARSSSLALRRSDVEAWAPSPLPATTTVVDMRSGRRHTVNVSFKEFHAWAIGPAAAQDKARAAAPVTPAKKKPVKRTR